MLELQVNLSGVLEGLEDNELIKLVAASYADNEYCVSLSEDLSEIDQFIDNDWSHDLLTRIQNTFANIDREYEEEDEYWDNDSDDYEDDDYEDNYENDYESNVDDATMRLIEENRRRNEQALGL